MDPFLSFIEANKLLCAFVAVIGAGIGALLFALRIYCLKTQLHALAAIGVCTVFFLACFFSSFYFFAVLLEVGKGGNAVLTFLFSIPATLVCFIALTASEEVIEEWKNL